MMTKKKKMGNQNSLKCFDIEKFCSQPPSTNMKSFREFIDAIYFINLNTRKDRKDKIEEELRKILKRESLYDDLKPLVIPYITERNKQSGSLGCSQSHIACIEDAIEKKFQNFLILEDDFYFQYDEKYYQTLLDIFFNLQLKWDVLFLGCKVNEYDITNFPIIIRVKESLSSTAYIVNRDYAMEHLLPNIKKGAKLLEKSKKSKKPKYHIDLYWRSLQKKHLWYTFAPYVLGWQRMDYSDIDHKIRNTNHYYNKKISTFNHKSHLVFVFDYHKKYEKNFLISQQLIVFYCLERKDNNFFEMNEKESIIYYDDKKKMIQYFSSLIKYFISDIVIIEKIDKKIGLFVQIQNILKNKKNVEMTTENIPIYF